MENKAKDLQRTPIFQYTDRDIPVPEDSILDKEKEYNRGELAAMDYIEEQGFSGARDHSEDLVDSVYDFYPDYVQGFCDALEVIATREA
jgi:hypothetical protein